ncbi:MAG: YncE family protein [Betaproteobacteria bacterium]|nr:YncE family protein [Betaproteobacteria bacterium]
MKTIAIALLAAGVTLAPLARAQLAVSANDNKVVLDNGTVKTVANPAPDTVSIIDLGTYPPKLLAELAVPASVVGPPLSVALAPDESIALVTSAEKIDPKDPTKRIPDNRVSVIDLKASPPRVIATLEAGAGAAGVSINHAGKLAIVANRAEGTVSTFSISGKTVTHTGKIKLGEATSGPSHVVFTPDDKRALVTRDGDNGLTMLAIDGGKVSATNRTFYAGLRPYGADISPRGDIAVVANVGRNFGDADTVSVIDLRANPPRTVDTITVGATPEGIKMSPDGKFVAVVIHNGTGKPVDSPFYNPFGKLLLYAVNGTRLSKTSEERIGRWSQGIAFSQDSKTVLVQNMVEKNIQVFRIEGDELRETLHRIPLKGGGAAIRTAEK